VVHARVRENVARLEVEVLADQLQPLRRARDEDDAILRRIRREEIQNLERDLV
jgi:hypothetical protein